MWQFCLQFLTENNFCTVKACLVSPIVVCCSSVVLVMLYLVEYKELQWAKRVERVAPICMDATYIRER